MTRPPPPAERESLLTSADVRLIIESNGCSYPGCAGNWDGAVKALNALLRPKLAAAIAETREQALGDAITTISSVREREDVFTRPRNYTIKALWAWNDALSDAVGAIDHRIGAERTQAALEQARK